MQRVYLEHNGIFRDRTREIAGTPSFLEELVRELLQDLSAASKVGYCRNHPLKLLRTEACSFSEEEASFIEMSAHADFVFFRTIEHSVFAEVEVNGTQHDTDPKQRERDSKKRSILEKMGIPQWVIRTNETERRVRDTLSTILRDPLPGGQGTASRAASTNPKPVVISSAQAPWK